PEQEQGMNRLAKETSPYLRQHANNPVDWYPWGPEALERAKKEDKPIFLSIGYAACHWCHVMEHESFENPAVAAYLNEHFINVKVDREERPDIDEIYMAAVQAMTGQGGWPMSMFLTPDLKPFYGGTYFPPEDSMGRPGFRRVAEHLADAWKNQRDKCVQGSEELTAHLQKVLLPSLPPGAPDAAMVTRMAEQSASRFDEVHAGFAQAPHFAPKFPHAAELTVLLRVGVGGDAKAMTMGLQSLDQMMQGGIYDQLGGGFHRYSVDREWLVPHFEKMLYDNAQLVPCYLEAYQLTGEQEYARVARETLDYLLREMQHVDGGFYSSQDADSEGVEGRSFVWQLDEFQEVLGDLAPLAASRWGVTAAGNWEHTNVLSLVKTVAELAKEYGLEESVVEERLETARQKLLERRNQRVQPGTDDKILTAWNGLAIEAFCRGYQVLGDEKYLRAAERAADFVLRELVKDGRCLRSWHSGKAQHMGYLEDYSFLADSLVTLFEQTGEPRWLVAAEQLLVAAIEHFQDEDGNFFFTADDHEELIARTKTVMESSTPSGMALTAKGLLRCGLLLGNETLYETGVKIFEANHALLNQSPVGCPSLVAALQMHLAEPREIVVVGSPEDARTAALREKVDGLLPPFHVTAWVHEGNRDELARLSPVFAGKELVDGSPAAYVCRRGVCEKPVTQPAELDR
ncbi:MAG: thioredoxin domain-containing protein, partial [Planctomycetota bacterium]|nr:thioredoxin domain-containing protein [Planctomycetota bacterium]